MTEALLMSLRIMKCWCVLLHAGIVDDLYQLQSPNTLHVVSRVTIGGRTETTLQVCWDSIVPHIIIWTTSMADILELEM